MTKHERLAARLAIRVFFANPYSLWQHGTNENTNRWAAAPVSTQDYESLGLYPAGAECYCASVEHAPEEMPRFCHAPGGFHSAVSTMFTRCAWNWKPPLKSILTANQRHKAKGQV